ncbi:hypothetical protein [Kitasatospora purpeofusca]|uniref:hypothetical protein n=1 Tax=Kitasatospora purpeofusca TaxID=67352 RepID=UPI0036983F08
MEGQPAPPQPAIAEAPRLIARTPPLPLESILLDARHLCLYDESQLDGVAPPRYDPNRAVIPFPAQLQGTRTDGDDTFRLIADLMSNCGLRHDEAAAVNLKTLVADNVYRITEQVNQTTKDYAPLKHRKERNTAMSRHPPAPG